MQPPIHLHCLHDNLFDAWRWHELRYVEITLYLDLTQLTAFRDLSVGLGGGHGAELPEGRRGGQYSGKCKQAWAPHHRMSSSERSLHHSTRGFLSSRVCVIAASSPMSEASVRKCWPLAAASICPTTMGARRAASGAPAHKTDCRPCSKVSSKPRTRRSVDATPTELPRLAMTSTRSRSSITTISAATFLSAR